MVHGETGCQLYLIVPPEKDHDAVLRFMEAGELGNFACGLLQSGSDGKIDRGIAETLLHYAHDANIPLLFEDDISATAELGADGVHIPTDEGLYSKARRILGDDAIIGVACGQSRHAGLTFAELGAHYIAFSDEHADGPDETIESYEELIAWWAETVTVPCVAWDLESMEMAQLLAETGTDFVALGDPLWSHPKGPGIAVRDLIAKLEQGSVPA